MNTWMKIENCNKKNIKNKKKTFEKQKKTTKNK